MSDRTTVNESLKKLEQENPKSAADIVRQNHIVALNTKASESATALVPNVKAALKIDSDDHAALIARFLLLEHPGVLAPQ